MDNRAPGDYFRTVAVPKRRKSASKRDQRRSQHDKVTPPELVTCDACGEVTVPHRACAACGWYKGRVAVTVKNPRA